MALAAARQTEVLHGGNVRVGRVVDTVVDKETGVAAQRERVLAAVPDEHGNVIVMMQERIRAVRVPPMVGSAIGRADTGLITAGPSDQSREGSGMLSLCGFCCMLCFLPCLSNKICLALFACLVLVPAAVLIGFTAAGPIQCTSNSSLYSYTLIAPASGITIGLICVILFILLLCFCIQCFQGEDSGLCRSIIYCCNCLAIILLLGLVIAGSVLVFMSNATNDPDCRFPATPIATMALSYAFILFTCCCWCLCCCVVINSHKQDA